LTADIVEKRLVVFLIHRVGNNTGQRVSHAVTDGLIWSWRQCGVGRPVGTHSWASGDRGRSGLRVNGSVRWADGGKLAQQVLEVGHSGDRAAGINANQTVVVGLLVVHVDNTSRPDTGHVARVKSLDLGELSWLNLVTSVLREENWNTQVLVLRGDVQVTRGLEGGSTTPFIHVNTEEISSLILITASKVVSQVNSDLDVVVTGVSHRNGSVALFLNVGLGVSDSSLDVSGSIGVGGFVGDLVTSKETHHVGVVVELVHHVGVSGQQVQVPLRVGSVDGEIWLGQVGNHIDASLLQ